LPLAELVDPAIVGPFRPILPSATRRGGSGMKRHTSVIFALLVLTATASAHAAPQPPYYLALGDSLSRGIQPQPNGTPVETNQGYVDDVYAYYRLRHPQLQLAKLGCSGETTTTMIKGGVCPYPAGSQLAQAIAFLQTHRVALVTLTIGGDDILHCISLAGVDTDCVTAGLNAVGNDLPQILAALRAAAGPKVPIVAANYYDPIVAASLLLPPPGGQVLADLSLQGVQLLNGLLETLYTGFGVPVADVARAFHITDPALVPGFNVPLNVFLAITWTWIAAPPRHPPQRHRLRRDCRCIHSDNRADLTVRPYAYAPMRPCAHAPMRPYAA
jgi:lysophospholipase L1-like esterase